MNKHARVLKFASMTALMQNQPKTDWAALLSSIAHFNISTPVALAVVLFFAVSTSTMALILPSEFSVADYQPTAVHSPHASSRVLGAKTPVQALPGEANAVIPINAQSYVYGEEYYELAGQKIYDRNVFKVYLNQNSGKSKFPASFLIEINGLKAETNNAVDAQILGKSLVIVVNFSDTLLKSLSSAQANSAVFAPLAR